MDLRTWTQVVHPDDVQENAKQWQRAIKSGKPFYFEHRLRRSDGTYRWHLCRAHAMHDSAGRIVQWLGSDTDIEAARQSKDLKTRLKEVAEQREELLAMNRAKDEFIMLASHQLRTPATGVKQFVGMLLEGFGGDVPANQRSMLEQAYDCNERQIQIVNDLLRVAQVDAGKVSVRKAPCDVTQLVHGISAELRDTFNSREQTVTISGSRKKITALIDTKLMRMVLENLLDNASKYSPAGKPIRVDVQHSRKTLVIKVEDSGVGIRKKDQPKLFQKFSRIDNPLSEVVGGTGLGLYWAKKIVELHGGTLGVVSKMRYGSTFAVTLPD
jgi:signal transduction histidine kinase